MQHAHYAYSGLRVVSELRLPEWAAFETARPLAPQVRIVVGDPSADMRVEAPPNVDATRCAFYVPGVGAYDVRGGSRIAVQPVPEAGSRELRLFLLGAAWSALLYQRGLTPMHAGVVRAGTGALAFCGAAGAGKSTMTASLVRRGYGLVSDDLCRLDLPAAGAPRVWPSTVRLKLWRDTLDALGWSDTGLERDYFRADKFHLPWTGERAHLPAPLRAIYVLAWGELRLSRLTGMEALRRLVADATYRGDLLAPMGVLARHWQRCAELLRRVPVWELRRPRDWEAMDAVEELIAAHGGR